MPPLPTLVCKQCGYVNEGERVYCHGCGAKLDRDVIAAREQQKAPSREEKQREVKRIMSPRRGMGQRVMGMFFRTLLLAAIVAGFVTAGHAPEGATPLDAKKELVDAPMLEEFVERFVTLPMAQRRAIGDKEVTLFLRNERFRKVPSWFMEMLPLKRVYVNFEEGAARLTVGGALLGWPVYAGWTGYFQRGAGGTLEPVCNGGFIGHLSIHPELAKWTAGAVPMVVSSAERGMKLLGRLESIQFSKGQAILANRPPVAPAVAPAAAKPVSQPARLAPGAPLQAGFR